MEDLVDDDVISRAGVGRDVDVLEANDAATDRVVTVRSLNMQGERAEVAGERLGQQWDIRAARRRATDDAYPTRRVFVALAGFRGAAHGHLGKRVEEGIGGGTG